MTVFYVYDPKGCLSHRHYKPLNIRQLFNPLFFERSIRHPDMKRQRIYAEPDWSTNTKGSRDGKANQ